MLRQGVVPGPKCKLNISSFLALPNLLDCLFFTRNSVSIVLYYLDFMPEPTCG